MDEARSFAPLLIVVMLAFLVPLLLSSIRGRLAIPIVVSEIVAGMIVGRSGFGWVVPDNGALDVLKELGFVLLMFLSGMEIDFRSLRGTDPHQSRWSPLSLAVLNFTATLLIAGAFGWGLKWIGDISSFLLSSIKGALRGSVLTAQFMELDPFLLALKKKYPAPDIQTHRDRSSWAILWSPRPPMRKIYT